MFCFHCYMDLYESLGSQQTTSYIITTACTVSFLTTAGQIIQRLKAFQSSSGAGIGTEQNRTQYIPLVCTHRILHCFYSLPAELGQIQVNSIR